MRLDISEWSVEYDELTVTIWISTKQADYKLLSAAPEYLAVWQALQRKTVTSQPPSRLPAHARHTWDFPVTEGTSGLFVGRLSPHALLGCCRRIPHRHSSSWPSRSCD